MGILVDGALLLILAGAAAIVITLVFKLFKGSGDRATKTEDAQVIQEIYRSLGRMEKRVDTLETILFDRKQEDRRE